MLIKRMFDICAAGLAVSLLSPLLAVLTLMVRFKLGSPVLFSQTRPGLHGKPFTMYKFRTMTNDRDSPGQLLSPFGPATDVAQDRR